MNTYKTSEVARIIGIHPNTVRLYEELKLIPIPVRETNGYRIFTDYHIEQLKLARLAFQIELVQNGLRKKIVHIIRCSADGDFGTALSLSGEYLQQIMEEQKNAAEGIKITEALIRGETPTESRSLKRSEASEYLNISMDTLRNWELNGLLTVKRKENGYRVYTEEDIRKLKVIRVLRCAGYSLEAILRLFHELNNDPNADIGKILNTPKAYEDIISVCDKLMISLQNAEKNARIIIKLLEEMREKYSYPSL